MTVAHTAHLTLPVPSLNESRENEEKKFIQILSIALRIYVFQIRDSLY